MKKVISLLLVNWALLFIGCTTQGTSWDVDAYAPVVETTLDVTKLFGDENILVNGDSSVWLNINADAFTFNLDTATEFPQFTAPFAFLSPFTTTLAPGTPIPTQEIPIDLAATGVELRELWLKEGKLKLTLKSTAAERLAFTYYIPAATYGGIPFSFSDTIPGVPAGAPPGQDTVYYSREFDVSNFHINTTGPFNNELNTFSAYVDVSTILGDNGLPLVINQVIFVVTNEMVDIVPEYGKGYLGQYDFSQNNITAKIEEMKLFQSGVVDIEQISLNLTVKNTIGAEVRFRPVYFKATNTRTGGVLWLTHPEMGSTININRAYETGISSNPLVASQYTYSFNTGNSNLEQIIELLPDELNFTAEMKLNPFGNIGGYTDFYYTDYPAKVETQIQAPLKFSISQLMFVDTVINPFASLDILDNVVDGQFIIRAENKFPIAMNVQLYALDNTGLLIDSVLVNDLIPAAPVNIMNRVVTPISADLIATVNPTQIANLKNATSIRIRATFNTQPAAAGRLQMYSDYYLKLKLIADIKYHIVL